MILRRLAQALRNQNWFTVFVEIMVVIIGLLIGFQVDRWWEKAKTAREEANYLSLLKDDVSIVKARLDDLLFKADQRITSMHKVLRALETCSVEMASDDDFQLTLPVIKPPRQSR